MSGGKAGGISFGGNGSGFSFGSSTPSTAAATGAGGFNFGAGPASTASATPGSGFAFGAAPTASQSGGFSFGGGGATSSTAAAQPGAGGLSFGGAGGVTTQPAQPSTVGFNFGLGGSSTDTTAAASTAAPGVSFNFGGGGAPSAAAAFPALGAALGATQATTTASSLATLLSTPASATTQSTLGLGGTAPTSSTGFNFGPGLAASTAQSSATAPTTQQAAFAFASPIPATTTATATGFNLGLGLGSAASTVPGTSAPSLGLSLGGSKLGATTTAPASTAATSLGFLGQAVSTASGLTLTSIAGAGDSKPAGRQMTYKQLEEETNKWMAELQEQERNFLLQATQVNAWDRLVLENGEKIVQLNSDLERVKLEQQKLDHELDFVHSQQRELGEMLGQLEAALESMPAISYQQHADLEREHTYQLAESLDAQLKRMGTDLKEIIERLNSSNSKPDPDDPVQQITKILNAHMDSLLWIDRQTGNLNRRVEEMGKLMESERKEQERNFRLAYS